VVQRGYTAVEVASTASLSSSFLRDLRATLDAAFEGRFSEDDWQHALGGIHAWLGEDGRIISHASVVERSLVCSGVQLRAGYVEAVATVAERRREGHGSAVMRRIGDIIQQHFGVGVLSTGAPAFYERLGWECWRGPTYVSAPGGLERTPEDDGGVMILRTPRSANLDLEAAIVCDWRQGDVW
jgi:aminoglycoside 2'-N-acetyltransferase I